MQNVLAVYRAEFHALSNGAFVFAVSRTLCTGKWRKLLAETVPAFQLHHSKER
jgi:hypothetical protein